MVHLWFLTEGNKWQVDKYIAALSGQIYQHVDTQDRILTLTYNIRPVQLWSLSTFNEELPQVLKTLAPYNNMGDTDKGTYFSIARAVARVLGVKPVPNVQETMRSLPRNFVNVFVLGKTMDHMHGGREFV